MRHQRLQRHRCHHQAQHAGLDARQVERVVDHLQQVPAGLQDLPHPTLLVGGQSGLAVEVEQLPEAQHRVQRCAQLVAHARQELVFRPVGRFGQLSALLGLLEAQLLGDVLDHRHQALRLAVGVAQHPPVHAHRQHGAVAVLQPGVALHFGQLVAQQPAERQRVVGAVVGVGQVGDGAVSQGVGVVADQFAQARVGVAHPALQVGVDDADRCVVEDVAEALLAFTQRRFGALALGHFVLQVGGALGHRCFNAAGAAGHCQQQCGQHGRRQQPDGGKQPGVAVAGVRHLGRIGDQVQHPALAAQGYLGDMAQHARRCQLAARCAGQQRPRRRRLAADQAPTQVGRGKARGGLYRLRHAQRDEHHAPQRLAPRRGFGFAQVEGAIQHHASLAARFLRQLETSGGRRRIGGGCAQDGFASRRHRQRVDAQCPLVGCQRLD